MDKKYCAGCHDNYYNHSEKNGCWSFKDAKLVWRLPVHKDERQPYKKKAIQVPDCYHGGSDGMIYIKKEALTDKGFWKG
jgi:hypothetical protein